MDEKMSNPKNLQQELLERARQVKANAEALRVEHEHLSKALAATLQSSTQPETAEEPQHATTQREIARLKQNLKQNEELMMQAALQIEALRGIEMEIEFTKEEIEKARKNKPQ